MLQLSQTLGRLLEWILITLMVTLTIVVIVAVVYRKMGASLSWYDEIASIMLSWITYYGAALAALRRRHIGFDGIILALPPTLRKLAIIIAEILVLAFFGLLAWAGWEVLKVLEGEALVSLTWMPIQFTQSVIPIGAVLFIICELLSLPFYWKTTMMGHSLDHPEIEAEGS